MRWRDLAGLLRPVRGQLAAAAALQAVAAAASLVPYVCVVEIARRLLDPPADTGTVRALVVAAIAAFGVRLITQGAAGQITHLADNTFQLGVRRRVATHLGRLPLGWFGARHSGEVKRAVQDDVAAMHYMVAHSLPDLVAGVVAPALSLAYLASVDWRLTLITAAPLVVFGVLYAGIVQGYAAQMDGHALALGRVNASAVELVHGIEVTKAFGEAGEVPAGYARSAEEFAGFHDRWVRPIALRSAVAEFACSAPAMLLTVLAGGVALVAWGGLAPVDVIPFALLGLGLSAPLLTLGYSAQGFRLAAEAAGRVCALLATPAIPEPAPGARRALDGAGVRFDAASFSYDGRAEVLRAITAELRPGTVTALVGASGAGKSTLAALVPRFWDVTGGAVRVGGADVREVAGDDLYASVAFVFQDPSLIHATVRENIALGRPGASRADVEGAARAAGIHDRVTALPRGYDAVVGEDARLSGGEQQRLAIARALLADRPVLVLDEATSFADLESEALLQDALSRLAVGRTVLVIAHRLSTVTRADRILVLAGGRLAESGRHEDLLVRGGEYARLWEIHRAAGAGT